MKVKLHNICNLPLAAIHIEECFNFDGEFILTAYDLPHAITNAAIKASYRKLIAEKGNTDIMYTVGFGFKVELSGNVSFFCQFSPCDNGKEHTFFFPCDCTEKEKISLFAVKLLTVATVEKNA